MFRLSNGVEIELIAESGAMGFGRDWWPEKVASRLRWPWGPWWGKPLHEWRLFDAIILKTLTFPPRAGNISSYSLLQLLKVMRPITKKWLEGTTIRENGISAWLRDSFTIVGWMNAIGLRNPGLYGFLRNYYLDILKKRIAAERLNIIVSVAPAKEQEAAVMAQELNKCKFAGLVYNAKDQAHPEEIVRLTEILRQESRRLPVMIKLDPHQPIRDLVLAVKDFAEAVFINSCRFKDRFPDRTDPMSWCGGCRISGEAAHPITWRAAREATWVGVLPVVWPIWEYRDILFAEAFGASAFSMASRFILFPWKANDIARRLKKRERRCQPSEKG